MDYNHLQGGVAMLHKLQVPRHWVNLQASRLIKTLPLRSSKYQLTFFSLLHTVQALIFSGSCLTLGKLKPTPAKKSGLFITERIAIVPP